MRRFRVPEGRVIVLPQGLLAGPGATNLRLDPGKTVDLEDDRCQQFGRYINGRLRAGDLVEDASAPDPDHASAAPPPAATADPVPMQIPEVPAPKKKER